MDYLKEDGLVLKEYQNVILGEEAVMILSRKYFMFFKIFSLKCC